VLIHSIDQGRRSGYAFGPAGEAPVRRGPLILRESDEPRCVGFGNLIHFLDKTWQRGVPDLLIMEEPMSIVQWFQSNRNKKFPTDSTGVSSGYELTAIIAGMAERYGIKRVETVRRQTILVHILGKGNGRLSRDVGKDAIVQYMIDNGYVEPFCEDQDMCDAIAMHIYASDKFARVPQKEFKLFPPAHHAPSK
jgi:hypothetical protein